MERRSYRYPSYRKALIEVHDPIKNLQESQFNYFSHSWQHLPLVFWHFTNSENGAGGQEVQSFSVGPKLFSLCSLWRKQDWDTVDLEESYMPVIISATETAEFCFCTFKIVSMVKSMLRKPDKCNIERNWTGTENDFKFTMKTVSCMKSRNKEALVYQAAVCEWPFL